MDATRAQPPVDLEQPRCPFCRDAVRPGEAQLACNHCRAWHHEDCWAEGGERCGSCGSSATGRSAEAAPASGRPREASLLRLAAVPPAAALFAALGGVLGMAGVGVLSVLAGADGAAVGRWAGIGYGAFFLGIYALLLTASARSARADLRRRLEAGAALSLVGPLGVAACALLSWDVPVHWAWVLPWPYYAAWTSALLARRPEGSGDAKDDGEPPAGK